MAIRKPRLLDLFCGAGGAAMGYHRAGFEVVGVDIKPQPHYPFEFYQDDAMAVLRSLVDGELPEFPYDQFDAIHASPPCQGYANLGNDSHPRLIAPVRELLRTSGRPYVIENIQDAKPFMEAPVVLCGSSFDLHVRRHRLFESSELMAPGKCQHAAQGEIRGYYGKPGWLCWTPGTAAIQKKGRRPLLRGSVEKAPDDMGIDWMTWDELREAIPPAYTEWIGRQLMEALKVAA